MQPKNNRKINIIKSNQRKTWTKQNKNLEIKKKKKKKNKNLDFKCNINVKAMTSGVHQKSSTLNLLVLIK